MKCVETWHLKTRRGKNDRLTALIAKAKDRNW
jgi:hypothetical protein